MRLNARLGVTRRIDRIRGRYAESVIQDVDIPLARAPDFLELLHAKIGILPIRICPIRPSRSAGRFKLYRLDPDTLYVNFGFWDVVRRAKAHDAGHFNRIVERAVMAAGGIKSLYSDSFFTREEFWSIYERAEYVRLKSRYDPQGALGDLYDKCVLGQ